MAVLGRQPRCSSAFLAVSASVSAVVQTILRQRPFPRWNHFTAAERFHQAFSAGNSILFPLLIRSARILPLYAPD